VKRNGAIGNLNDVGSCYVKQIDYGSKYSFTKKEDVEKIISFIKDPSKG